MNRVKSQLGEPLQLIIADGHVAADGGRVCLQPVVGQEQLDVVGCVGRAFETAAGQNYMGGINKMNCAVTDNNAAQVRWRERGEGAHS